jgi:hypothetical protein
MRRCALALGFAGVFGLLSAPAFAQAPRNFSASALRGELTVTAPPEVLLNRQPARLSPGTRIRGANNLLVMSGAIVGQRLLVHYTLDLHGNMLDVWILTPEEANRQPWPVTPAEAAAWSFNADQQVWTKP